MEQPGARAGHEADGDPVELATYVPALVVRRFADRHAPLGEAETERFVAAVLFADISGFTMLPDVLRLLRRLAGDRSLPRGVRIRLWLLLVYLAIPIDLVPDFIPVLGYADGIIVMAVLRSVVRRAGLEPIRGHWPGTEDGLAAVLRLCGLTDQPDRIDRA